MRGTQKGRGSHRAFCRAMMVFVPAVTMDYRVSSG